MPPSEEDAALRLSSLIDGAWAAAAYAVLGRSGVLGEDGVARPKTAEERAAMGVLAAVGLDDLSTVTAAGMLSTSVEGTVSSLRQIATAIEGAGAEGWAAQDDETLLAQGRASAMAGTMLARMAVPTLEGLAARFDGEGGVFLDVGVGVGELSAAFCDALPRARVIGLDVMPRVLELARRTVAERGLTDRVDLRLVGVQDLADEAIADLAWLPAPFIPEAVFDGALVALHRAVRPGGWLVVAAGRLDDGDALAIAVTRWKTVLAGGTPLPRAEVAGRLAAAGFGEPVEVPMPPTAPALYAVRRG